eukprot:CAMPEP_0184480958 /NCGR_PEP_ID=MMETSP0113_2-20130426/2504_1 /TAXON_ID=91329 /ORGANISM="Norrisiella sphaerica, Strain BC52" /LENGTH=303 /DNA_ID=CAMNT_0026859799 /DNA_START=128 /DNA_END=1040 /DNA_ORIENTATION=-
MSESNGDWEGGQFGEMGDSLADLRQLGKEIEASSLVYDRKHYLRRYERCFVGEEFCSYLVRTKRCRNGKEAAIIGNKMLQFGVIEKIYGARKTFENSRGFYRVASELPFPKPPSVAAPEAPTEANYIRRESGATTPPIDLKGVVREDSPINMSTQEPSSSGKRLSDISALSQKVYNLEESVRKMEQTFQEARSSISQLLQRQKELKEVHLHLNLVTSSIQRTLLRLVALCMLVLVAAKVLPELVGDRLASGIGWTCTALAGAVTITVGADFKSWAASSEGAEPRGLDLSMSGMAKGKKGTAMK